MNKPYEYSDLEKHVIRRLQEEFPLCEEPFRQIAASMGIDEAQVIDIARDLQNKGSKFLIAIKEAGNPASITIYIP